MRIYQCDCCEKVISDPYTVKMKEFYLGMMDTDSSSGIVIPIDSKRKIKIHLIMVAMCGNFIALYAGVFSEGIDLYPYCPYCGAKMDKE